ncbi:MFS transporter [Pseudonocardia yuanmonensis]|uniref:MFS transporter n=1 Tax=Pseudonocardia yuanmonensis TaxID=1095914 RepID=A0ABP8XQT0_9PSEU
MVRTTSHPSHAASRRNIRLGSLGAALEYYDFVAYLYVATLIGQAFFPAETSDTMRLVQTLSVYAIGMVVRPLAGVVIARVADRVGRKKMFILTVVMMSVSTLVIGVSPTYEQAGWIAPALLVLMRIVQGCAVGGELPGAAVFVTEHARPGSVARAGAFQQMTAYSGFLLGAAAAFLSGLLVEHLLPSLPSLAWRLPFIIGGVLGLITLYLRRRLDETPEFVQETVDGKARPTPMRVALAGHGRAIGLSVVIVVALALANSTYFQFWPTYLQSSLHLAATPALFASLIGISAAMLSMPVWGLVADRYGWRTELGLAALLTAATTVVLLLLVPATAQSPGVALWMQLPAALAVGGLVSAVPGLVSAVFPTAVRQTGYALSYNLVVAVVGGPFNVVMVWLIATLGVSAPMYVVLVASALTLLVALLVGRVRLHLGPGAAPVTDGPLGDADDTREATTHT